MKRVKMEFQCPTTVAAAGTKSHGPSMPICLAARIAIMPFNASPRTTTAADLGTNVSPHIRSAREPGAYAEDVNPLAPAHTIRQWNRAEQIANRH